MKELSLHILDIVQNSLTAGAQNICVEIKENIDDNFFKIKIADDGEGMNKKEKNESVDPFVTSRQTRDVGLGLPLFKETAEACAGFLEVNSKPGEGTEITAYFEHNHIDRPPLGDMAGTITTIIALNPELILSYKHIYDNREFIFDSKNVKEKLNGVAINNNSMEEILSMSSI
ncbi:MAG: ATP-binding protein, partial [Halanaerobiales bacterium]